ncbi:MAG TPA: SMP-30/gluconolactonase/LRE family protein [Mycobacterium sp.]|nr:SMP-30/gluconolactonase/LRE family protein [Mycobacterium sp.]HNM85540.1 SMP-30/gluconolactonase/LRE family protein [Mycobacterium sp.]
MDDVDVTSARAVEPDPFVEGIVYGEGPRWHDGRLWFTDGPAGRVYSAGEDGDLTVEAEVPHASGLGWLPDGTLVVSTLFEPKVHHVTAGVLTTVDLGAHAFTTNDLLVTPDGRTYVDLYRLTDAGIEGDIALLGSGGDIRVVASGLATPNGIGMLPDGSALVVSETMGSRILRFPVRSDGTLGTATVFADLGSARHPDGLCVDAEGAVWVGCYDTGEFLRVGADGTATHRVVVEAGWAVAPALGGPDGRTLYLVIDDTTHEDLVNSRSKGCIMQARVDVPGIGLP